VINYELASVQRSSKICHQRSEDTVAGCVHEILSDVLMFHSNNPNVWPMWELGNSQLSRLASRVESRIRAELLTMLQLMLPGTNTFYYGEELGMRNLPNDSMIHPARGAMQWDDSAYGGFSSASQQNHVPIHSDYKNINWAQQFGEPRSQLKMFIKLARLRKRDETLMVGQTFIGKRVGDGFTLTRFLYENGTKGQVYITGINLGNSAVALPLNDIPGVTTSDLRKSQVVAVSSTVTAFSPRDSIDLSAKILNLPPEQGLVLRFAAC